MYDNAQMNTYMKDRWKRRREQAIAVLGGQCVKCGGKSDLEFDHIDPATKTVTIARSSSFSEERFFVELAKCQLLCHDCHKDKHKASHGTLARYRDCRCTLCMQARREWQRAYRLRKKYPTVV